MWVRGTKRTQYDADRVEFVAFGPCQKALNLVSRRLLVPRCQTVENSGRDAIYRSRCNAAKSLRALR
ncbi:MAG TPA: hypothetical protein DD670_04205 [Planctomycetaceae bacterium]|nr:hypothetical protein [Planctomycetaceae bacterium]